MSLPEDEKSLLAGSVMVSQWAQMEENHTVSLSEVQNFIGQVAERVIQLITRTRGSVEARTDDPRCVRMMLNCINQVLYEDLGFQGNMEDYYAPENSYIEKVFSFSFLLISSLNLHKFTSKYVGATNKKRHTNNFVHRLP